MTVIHLCDKKIKQFFFFLSADHELTAVSKSHTMVQSYINFLFMVENPRLQSAVPIGPRGEGQGSKIQFQGYKLT